MHGTISAWNSWNYPSRQDKTWTLSIWRECFLYYCLTELLTLSRRTTALCNAQTVCCYEISSMTCIQHKQPYTCLADFGLRTLFTVSVWWGCNSWLTPCNNIRSDCWNAWKATFVLSKVTWTSYSNNHKSHWHQHVHKACFIIKCSIYFL